MPPLTELQQKKVEENMGLVGLVIRERIHNINGIGIFSYDDLFQIGCIGLCKAVQTDRPGRGAFSTYAYRIIQNEILTQLAYATIRRREQATDPGELPCFVLDDDVEQAEACHDLELLLDRAEAEATGVTAKGIQAIRLLIQGYTNREIGEQFGTTANNITAWVSKARKYLTTQGRSRLSGVALEKWRH